MAKLSEILRERGYVYQQSSETLEEITDGAPRTVYLGVDPTADSLHVGNLIGLLVLRRFLENGHRIIILTGGGTGMIGDPGGKSEERNLLDENTVARNTKAVAAQIQRIFGDGDFIQENNAKWLKELSLLEFLRDVGKHFTINAMIKKDIVKDRLDSESAISFTEFSYSLLQGYDFFHLNAEYGCDVQVGGSDQWSNILAGVEFVRKKSGKAVYGLTWPLIVSRSTGKKFGKSESGAVWLDSEKTSFFDFYQFFLNTDDSIVEELLLLFTMISTQDIREKMQEHRLNPAARAAQKLLADAVTLMVHRSEGLRDAARTTEILFSQKSENISDDEWKRLNINVFKVAEGAAIVDVLVESGLAASKREARTFLSDGAVTLGGTVLDENKKIEAADFNRRYAVLRRGKRFVRALELLQN